MSVARVKQQHPLAGKRNLRLEDLVEQPYLESGVLTVLIEDLGLDIGGFGIIVRPDHELSPGAQIMLNA